MERLTKSELADKVYSLAEVLCEEENYDILDDGYLPSDLANAAANIFKSIIKTNGHGGWIFKTAPVSVYTLGVNWKVRNSRPCFISCSDDNATGISHTLGCIFARIYGLDEDDVKELLDMMNEAWYLMKNPA